MGSESGFGSSYQRLILGGGLQLGQSRIEVGLVRLHKRRRYFGTNFLTLVFIFFFVKNDYCFEPIKVPIFRNLTQQTPSLLQFPARQLIPAVKKGQLELELEWSLFLSHLLTLLDQQFGQKRSSSSHYCYWLLQRGVPLWELVFHILFRLGQPGWTLSTTPSGVERFMGFFVLDWDVLQKKVCFFFRFYSLVYPSFLTLVLHHKKSANIFT